MPVQTIYVGDTLPLLVFTAVDELRNPIALTGATCSVLFAPATGQPGFAGGGSFTSITGNTAVYQMALTDTATPGRYAVQLVATFAQGDQSFQPLMVELAERVVPV